MYLYIVSVKSIFAKHFLLLYSIWLDLASIRTCYLCIEGFVIYSLKPSVFVSWQSSAVVDAYKSVIRFFSTVVGKLVKLEGRGFFFGKSVYVNSRLVLGGFVFEWQQNANRTQFAIPNFTVGLQLLLLGFVFIIIISKVNCLDLNREFHLGYLIIVEIFQSQ